MLSSGSRGCRMRSSVVRSSVCLCHRPRHLQHVQYDAIEQSPAVVGYTLMVQRSTRGNSAGVMTPTHPWARSRRRLDSQRFFVAGGIPSAVESSGARRGREYFHHDGVLLRWRSAFLKSLAQFLCLRGRELGSAVGCRSRVHCRMFIPVSLTCRLTTR